MIPKRWVEIYLAFLLQRLALARREARIEELERQAADRATA